MNIYILLQTSILINTTPTLQSLSAFGDVISARLNKHNHIPFRNSLLTYLLQESLSGDSKVLMILHVSVEIIIEVMVRLQLLYIYLTDQKILSSNLITLYTSVIQVGPALNTIEESVNSLKFGVRVQNVENNNSSVTPTKGSSRKKQY